MRRKYLGLAIAAFATFGPIQAWGGDREIAEQIIKRLKSNRDSGALKDFTLDMKVDKGVVLFRGNVSQADQKQLVLGAAEGIEGIANVRDELTVTPDAPEATVLKPKAAIAVAELKPAPAQADKAEPAGPEASDFSFREALVAQARQIRETETVDVMPGFIQPAAAIETTSDEDVVSAVVSALGRAKDAGKLKGFGVDVKSDNGVLQLTGRAASTEQRNTILRICEGVPGVAAVREAIVVNAPEATRIATELPVAPQGRLAAMPIPSPLSNVPTATLPRQPIAAPTPLPMAAPAQVATATPSYQQAPAPQAMTAPYRTQGQPQVPARNASVGMPMGSPIVGQPVPMAPHSAVGAPRYDTPNLPNYAWPGYAAHPNYAAVTYPQQYSPTAWPYIGPFYPYPQVPLGWRKVSLEWDDGWWFLDFTDR